MKRRLTCPICHGTGTTHLIAAGGKPQGCGICHGAGALEVEVPCRWGLTAGRWWIRLRLGPFVLGVQVTPCLLIVARWADPGGVSVLWVSTRTNPEGTDEA